MINSYSPTFSNTAFGQVIEEINSTGFLSELPKEIILEIFSKLSPIELAKCSEVSRKWRRLASDSNLWNALDLKKLFPSLRVFDESDWQKFVDLSSYELSMEDAPPTDKRKEIPALKRLLSFLPIERNAGVTLLTIPKGLTFNKLIELAGSPKLGNATNFQRIWDRVLSEFGNIPVDKTYRIVITNNILEASRNLSAGDQKELLEKFGCKMPKILEAATLLVVTYMNSQQRLYDNWTYTRCSEEVCRYHLVIGGFVLAGLDADILCYNCSYTGIVGVLRNF